MGTLATFKLLIKNSAYWNLHSDQDQACDFYYDIIVDYENWLLCGHKKRLFTAKVQMMNNGSQTACSLSLLSLQERKVDLTNLTC